ncbi:MAG: leucine-rich repeat protein, partial [Eubacteriales bacterium]|nr:leucine-rich repeat protein [Eubacteriales bacterium]
MTRASASENLAVPMSEAGAVPTGYTGTGSAGTGVDYYYYADGSTDEGKTFAAGTLYVKGTGAEDCAMTSASAASGYAWYTFNAKKVVVENVPSITTKAFGDNMSLEEVVLSGVTTLGSKVFSGSLNVKKIDLGEEMTSWDSVVINLPRLTHIKIPASVTALNNMNLFKGCSNIRDIAIAYTGEDDFIINKLIPTSWPLKRANFYVTDLEGKAATAIKTTFAGTEEGTLKEGYTINTMDKYEQKVEKELEISAEEKQCYLGETPKLDITKNTTGSDVVNQSYFTYSSRLGTITAKTESDVEVTVGSFYAYALVEGNDSTFASVSNISKVIMAAAYEYTLQDGVLTLQAADGMTSAVIPTMTGSAAPWYADKDTITKVVIKNTISKLGGSLFSGYTNLTEVEFEDGSILTSIGSSIFYNTGLTSVALPDSLTSIGSDAFNGCASLTSVTLPKELKTIEDNVFSGTGLTSIQLSDSITRIGSNAFQKTPLTSITLPDGLTEIGSNAFNGTSLTSVTLPDGLTSIGTAAFSGVGLTAVTIPDSVTSLGDSAFKNTQLTTLTIPENVTGTVVLGSIPTLTELYIYGNCEISLKSETTMRTTLKKVVYGRNVETIPENAFYQFTELTDLVMEEGCALKSIGAEAFEFSGLTGELYIPGTIENIGKMAFYSTSLERVVIGDSEKDISIATQAFTGSLLSEVVIKNAGLLRCEDNIVKSDADSCTILLYASDITNLDGSALTATPIQYSEKITCKLTQETAYATLSKRYETISPKPVIELLVTGVQTTEDGVQYVADYAENVITIVGYTGDAAEIIIPESIADMAVVKIGINAFKESGVTKVTLPASVTEIASGAFEGCSSLTEINLGLVVVIGDRAFRSVPLSSVTFSEGLVSIGEYAFNGGLKGDIILPDSVQSIGKHAFNGCGPEEGVCTIKLPANENYTKIESGTFANIAANTVVIPSTITEIGETGLNKPGYRGIKRGTHVLKLEAESLTTIPEGLGSYVFIANRDCDTYRALQNAGYTVVSSNQEAKTELTNVLDAAEKRLAECVKTDYKEENLTVLEQSIRVGKNVLENEESSLEDYLVSAGSISVADNDFYRSPESAAIEVKALRDRVAEIEQQYVPDDYTEET